jgi:uncharacterized membrane-anchored protein YjiN (DUF445 family)
VEEIMTLNHSKKPEKLPPWDEESLSYMAAHINESLTAAKGLLKTLQDELLVNTRIRVEVQKDLTFLEDHVEELNKLVIKGNGQKSLLTQVASLQSDTNSLLKRIEELKEFSNKISGELNTIDSKLEKSNETVRTNLESQSTSLRVLISTELKLLETSINERITIRKQVERDLEERQERQKDRHWALLTEWAPHLLTWSGFGLYILYLWWMGKSTP